MILDGADDKLARRPRKFARVRPAVVYAPSRRQRKRADRHPAGSAAG